MSTTGFDRLRSRGDAGTTGSRGRGGGGAHGTARRPGGADPLGRAVLFSATPSPRRRPAPFSALLDCSGCGASSAATLGQAVVRSVPGIHVPWLRRDHGSLMRCPACRRFRWMSVRVALR